MILFEQSLFLESVPGGKRTDQQMNVSSYCQGIMDTHIHLAHTHKQAHTPGHTHLTKLETQSFLKPLVSDYLQLNMKTDKIVCF